MQTQFVVHFYKKNNEITEFVSENTFYAACNGREEYDISFISSHI